MNRMAFEAVPPSRMSSGVFREKVTEKIISSVNSIKKVDLINVPEVIDENHEGKPYYRNIPVNEFCSNVSLMTGKKAIANKVVVHCNGMADFVSWLEKSINETKITNFVFVGGNSDKIPYPGITVNQANAKAKELNEKIEIGNIMIPSRKNEAQRMLSKTIGGADFFTSQVLFESDKTNQVISEYALLCEKNSVKPSEIFLSFCPVSNTEELDFLRWLGVEILPETEKKFIENPSSASVNISQNVWEEINDFAEKESINVNLSLNVEEIFFHNLELSVDLALKLLKEK